MDFKKFLRFVKQRDKKLITSYGNDPNIVILGRTVKLSEEVGELCEVILSSLSLQRKDKLLRYSSLDIADELADVVLVCFLLGQATGVNVENALEEKMKKNGKKFPGNKKT